MDKGLMQEISTLHNGVVKIEQALQSKWGGANWTCENSDYDKLNWLSEDVDKPSKAEIDAEITRLQAEYDAQQYARTRADKYPSWQEQMDMQYHDAVDGTTTWKETIKAVKDKYPKPQE